MGRGAVVSFPIAKKAPRAEARVISHATGLLSKLWLWIQAKKMARSQLRRLQVVETVSLGEKRFVALVQVDSLQFLIGGGPTAVSLLAQLKGAESFGEVLKKSGGVRRPARPKKQTDVSA